MPQHAHADIELHRQFMEGEKFHASIVARLTEWVAARYPPNNDILNVAGSDHPR